MTRIPIGVALLMACFATPAQIKLPERPAHSVGDPSMVVNDRGTQLEVLPDKRATTQVDPLGRAVVHRMTRTTTSAPINAKQLGVVFNHTLQQQGYITGEIAFKMKAGQTLTVSSTPYPGLKKLGTSGLYVVNARTPMEFIKLLKSLQSRTDLQFVEPVVNYGPSNAPVPDSR